MARETFETLKAQKEEWARQNPDDPEVPNAIHVWRDDEPIAMVGMINDRDTMMEAAHLIAYGMRADVLLLSFETLTASTPTNPVTGERWEANDMSVLAQTYPEAYEKGWIQDAFTAYAYTKDHRWWCSNVPYRVVDGLIEWGEEVVMDSEEMGEDGDTDGFIQTALRLIMEHETMAEEITQKMMDSGAPKSLIDELSTERVKVTMDLSTIAALHEKELATAAMLTASEANGERAEEIVKQTEGIRNTDLSRIPDDLLG